MGACERSMQTGVTAQQSKCTLHPWISVNSPVICMAAQDTVGELKEAACKAWGVDADDFKLFDWYKGAKHEDLGEWTTLSGVTAVQIC